LQIEPNNTKALFRRGKALLAQGVLDKAANDLNKARELDPTDKAIVQELAVLKQKDKQQDQKAKKVFSNMFKSAPEDTTTDATMETQTENK
jgi:tetratricopeptide (TPR) repeat protein